MTRWRSPDLTADERATLDALDLADEAELAWGVWSHADRAEWERMLERESNRGRRASLRTGRDPHRGEG